MSNRRGVPRTEAGTTGVGSVTRGAPGKETLRRKEADASEGAIKTSGAGGYDSVRVNESKMAEESKDRSNQPTSTKTVGQPLKPVPKVIYSLCRIIRCAVKMGCNPTYSPD